MMNRLAHLADRAPRRMLAGAAVFFVVAAVLGGSVADRLQPYGADDPSSESVQLRSDLERSTGIQTSAGIIALVDVPAGVRSAAARERVGRVAALLRGDRDVGQVTSFYTARDRALVARNGRATYVAASFRAMSDSAVRDAAERLEKRFDGLPGVRLGGQAVGFS
jgi:putative drug exporter of the RND superfamily